MGHKILILYSKVRISRADISAEWLTNAPKEIETRLALKQASENQGPRFESRSGIEVFQEKETIAI
jgi:hypothetical protein